MPGSYRAVGKNARNGSSQGAAVATIDLSAIHAIREYHPEDLTITVEAGMRLSTLKAELAQHGQWLPLDPPPVEDWTLGRLIA